MWLDYFFLVVAGLSFALLAFGGYLVWYQLDAGDEARGERQKDQPDTEGEGKKTRDTRHISSI